VTLKLNMRKSRLFVFLHLALLFGVVRLQCAKRDSGHKYGNGGGSEVAVHPMIPADQINETDLPKTISMISWEVADW